LVSWNAPFANGDAVASYTLETLKGGAVVNTLPGVTGTSANVVVAVDTTDYTFRVSALNKAGTSAPSAQSAPRRAAIKPGAPANVVLSPADRSVNVTFGDAAGNGSTQDELTYHYRVNETGVAGDIARGGGAIGGLNNGTTYTVNIWATSNVAGVEPGAEAGSNAAVPYGQPNAPGVSANNNATNVSFTITAPASNGRAIVKVEYRVNDGGWKSANIQGTTNDVTPEGYSKDYVIQAQATDELGNVSPMGSATGRSGAEPPPPPPVIKDAKVSIGHGAGRVGYGSCTHSSCATIKVTVSEGAPNSSYSAKVFAGGVERETITINTDGNGNGSKETTFYWGFPNTEVRATMSGPRNPNNPSTSW
jgi:hypothetical protein